MATYVNDLRLKEIATGDESGTWGTSTNTNLELIGEALGFGTEAITTNADTHTTTVADGSTDPGRAMYLKYTGTLDSACTITIAPNTMSRMHFIENGTSGSQNIIISQGSGANVTIPAGDVKAVYLDGAGSGAAVTDAFASLNTVDLKVEDDLTVTDDVSIGGALTLTGNGDFNGDLDVDGTTNLDVVDIDGAVDMASTLAVTGATTLGIGVDINGSDDLRVRFLDGGTFQGGMQAATTAGDMIATSADGDLCIRATNDMLFSADGNVEKFRLNSTGAIFNDTSIDLDFRVESNGNANMLFVDGGNDAVAIGTADNLERTFTISTGAAKTSTSTSTPFAIQSNESSANFRLSIHTVGGASAADRRAMFQTEEDGVANAGNIVLQPHGGSAVFGTDGNATFASGRGLHMMDGTLIGFGTGNGTRPDFQIGGDNSGLKFICGTGSDDADLTIDTNGHLGIGVSPSTGTLDVQDSTSSGNKILAYFVGEGVATDAEDGGQFIAVQRGGAISQVNSVTGGIIMGSNSATGSTAYIAAAYQFTSGRDIRFLVSNDNTSNPSLRMVLKGAGQLLIGHTSVIDGAHLTVLSNGGEGITNGTSGSNAYRRYFHTASTGIHSFTSTANTATLTNAGAWSNASDIAYKEDIQDIPYGLDTVKALRPRTYKMKGTDIGDGRGLDQKIGFVAQEAELVVPEVVDGVEGEKTLVYGELTAVLVKAIQELETRVATLEG
mgnify:FL=1